MSSSNAESQRFICAIGSRLLRIDCRLGIKYNSILLSQIVFWNPYYIITAKSRNPMKSKNCNEHQEISPLSKQPNDNRYVFLNCNRYPYMNLSPCVRLSVSSQQKQWPWRCLLRLKTKRRTVAAPERHRIWEIEKCIYSILCLVCSYRNVKCDNFSAKTIWIISACGNFDSFNTKKITPIAC